MSGPWEKYQAAAQAEAEAGPWTKFQSVAPVEKAPAKEGASILSNITQGAGNLMAGAVRGAGSIGATLIAPYDIAKDALAGKGLSLESNRQRRADIDAGLQTMGAEPDSMLYQGGKLGAEIAGTLGVGGALANGVRAVSAAPKAQALANAISSGGFRTGTNLAADASWLARAGDMGLRSAGGTITGGTSAAMVDPEHAGTGAVVGGVLPPVVSGLGEVGHRAAKGAMSIVKPFTAKGQDEIAGNVIRRFAEGGPAAVSAAQIVPNSMPTLAEATGNAGIARLQNAARDLRPNAFVERETQNAAARTAAFDEIAGDAGKLDFFKASRSEAAGDLYTKALDQANVPDNIPPYIKGQITQLLKRPSINDASKVAQRLAMERGERPAATGSLRALHDVKTALDDKIGEAVRAGKGGEAKALEATKSKLLDVMEKLSPEYGEARVTYAQMSQPINAMESLQGLRLTDAQGNITLAKVQNALRGLEANRQAPGVSAAKSVTDEQMRTLEAIRDDLLRQSNLGLGRSIGSNTFQNLATDNILNSFLGNGLSRLADRFGVAGAAGQVGRLAYSGPNEAIRNRIADMMLSPQLAEPALSGAPQLAAPNAFSKFLSDPRVQQPLYRAGPVLVSGQ